MKYLSRFLFLWSFLFLLASCQKDGLISTNTTTTIVAVDLETVSINLKGELTDELGHPLADALVSVGGKTTQTNAFGLWELKSLAVPATFAHVTFQSAGHLNGSRTVYARGGQTYDIDVQLLSQANQYQIDSETGGEVEIQGTEASIAFGQASFARMDGTPITSGEVNVTAHFLDVSTSDGILQMPGDLRGLPTGATEYSEVEGLISFGMVAVELKDLAGNEIQLADGSLATLTIPIPPEALATVPNKISLWYFDEIQALWIEEGDAERVGDAYVGAVSHFTFWNCSVSGPVIDVCGTLDIQYAGIDSLVLGSVIVGVSNNNGWTSSVIFTGTSGEFCGLVPADENLTFTVSDRCGNLLFERQSGPLTTSLDLGVVAVSFVGDEWCNVSGSLVCDGVPVTNGSAVLYQNGERLESVRLTDQGFFEIGSYACSADPLYLVVYDHDLQTETDQVLIRTGQATYVGPLPICGRASRTLYRIDTRFSPFDASIINGDSATANIQGSNFTLEAGTLNNPNEFFLDLVIDGLPVPIQTGSYPFSQLTNYELIIRSDHPGRRPFPVSMRDVPFDLSQTSIEFSSLPNALDNTYTFKIGPFMQNENDSNGVFVREVEIEIEVVARAI